MALFVRRDLSKLLLLDIPHRLLLVKIRIHSKIKPMSHSLFHDFGMT